eukprot:jgi/Botrbrau1/5216/Bobra.0172s0080.1
MSRLRFAMVCASNNNRSMEAHALLQKEGFDVRSFGVAGHVKLPGSSAKTPNVYDFGTPYKQMFEDLRKKDVDLYTRNGLLRMLERNMNIKAAPEKWQECKDPFDVVVTFEERVMSQLVDGERSLPNQEQMERVLMTTNRRKYKKRHTRALSEVVDLQPLGAGQFNQPLEAGHGSQGKEIMMWKDGKERIHFLSNLTKFATLLQPFEVLFKLLWSDLELAAMGSEESNPPWVRSSQASPPGLLVKRVVKRMEVRFGKFCASWLALVEVGLEHVEAYEGRIAMGRKQEGSMKLKEQLGC